MINFKKYISFITILFVLFVLYNFDSYWAASPDLAHHYGLIFRIGQNLHLINGIDSAIGIMSYYPPLSHGLAAILGVLLKSTFMGMQLLILASIFTLWLAIYSILSFLPRKLFIITILILFIYFFINKFYPILDIHGGEIITNFYFSQLVAQAIAFVSISIALYFDIINKKILAIFTLLASLVVLTCTHLVPALEVLIVLICVLVEINIRKIIDKKINKKILIFTVIILIISIGSIIINPWVIMMKNVASHNGGLTLLNIAYPWGIYAIISICIPSAIYLVFLGILNKELIALKYIGYYGIGVSTLCAMQAVALIFGFGSDYAVKKYIFGLNSFLIISFSIFIAFYINKKIFFDLRFNKIYVIFIPIFIFSVQLTLPSTSVLKVSNIVSLEQQIVALKNTVIQDPGQGKSNIIVDLNNMPREIDWMFSTAILNTPFSLAFQDAYKNSQIVDYGAYSIVVSGSQSSINKISNCKLSETVSGVVISNAECLGKFIKDSFKCSNIFDFTSQGFISESLIFGFSGPEVAGRWTDGNSATFSCYTERVHLNELVIYANPFIYKNHDNLVFVININGQRSYPLKLTSNDLNKPIKIDLSEININGKLNLDFKIINPISPKEMGLNSDPRKIGLNVSKILIR